jgi:hypothetical protein
MIESAVHHSQKRTGYRANEKHGVRARVWHSIVPLAPCRSRATTTLHRGGVFLGDSAREEERQRALRLTDHCDDEHDEEGVAHGNERHGEGGEDLLAGLEAAEEADDANGAEDADGEVEGAECDEGHEDDERVEYRPAVGEKVPAPVGEHVDEQLDGEDSGKGDVEVVKGVFEGSGGAVLREEGVVLELRFDDGRAEVLRVGARCSFRVRLGMRYKDRQRSPQ